MLTNLNKTKGFVLIEVVLALALFVLYSAVIIPALLNVVEVNSKIGMRNKAIFLAYEGLEATRNIKENDFTRLTDGSHGLVVAGGGWDFSGNEDVSGRYTRTVTVSSVDTKTKQAVVMINWQYNPYRNGSLSLKTYFSDVITFNR